ncbi:MAG: response regulator [Bdellovibrionales bacterium]|nr:response regulator [Bdellovibrionales bacterium]
MTQQCTKNILIVEDDKDIRESMKDALEIEGYKVLMASNGNEGLASLRSNDHTCMILLDLLMPTMGGREFMDIVQNEEKISSIPIFIHSSVANKENTIGAAGWIKKPADLSVILRAVKSYCS